MFHALLEIGIVAGPSIGGYLGLRHFDKKISKEVSKPKGIESNLVDGRTPDEWYDLIRGMGKDTYEQLSLGPLNGLERDNTFGWDGSKNMGKANWYKLSREWWPERFCKYCETDNCDPASPTCWEYNEHLRYEEAKKVKAARAEAEARYRKGIEAERKKKSVQDQKDRDVEIRELTAKLQKSMDAMKGYVPEAPKAKGYIIGQSNSPFAEFTPIRNAGMDGTRISYMGQSITLGRDEIRNFQMSVGIHPDGIFGDHTKVRVISVLRNGGAIDKYGRVTTFNARRDMGYAGGFSIVAERGKIVAHRTISATTFRSDLERTKALLMDALDRKSVDKPAPVQYSDLHKMYEKIDRWDDPITKKHRYDDYYNY